MVTERDAISPHQQGSQCLPLVTPTVRMYYDCEVSERSVPGVEVGWDGFWVCNLLLNVFPEDTKT